MSDSALKTDRVPLAFGLERIGLLSLAFPRLAAAVLVLLAIGAALGVTRLKVDDSLSQLFRSDSAEFRLYEEVTSRFPSSEYDVLVVVEGSSLLHRASLQKLRDLVTELQLIEGTSGLISLFSARQPPEKGQVPPPLFPQDLPEGSAYEQLIERVKGNEIIRGKLLSEDGELALIVIALDPGFIRAHGTSGVVDEIRRAVTDGLAGSALKGTLSGVPVMQPEIRRAVERDRLIYNLAGLLVGAGIAMLFFRRVSFMLIAAGPPLSAILLALGALGWLDFRLNLFLNVMTPLIMVLSFADSMQLTFAARDRLIAGEPKHEALRNALLIVGPACVLTHVTAGLSFLALQFSDSDLIRTFGQAGLIATVIALVAVLMLVPLFGMLLIRTATQLDRPEIETFGVAALRRFCAWIAGRMVDRAALWSLVGLAIVAGLGVIYSGLEPRYRLADQVPERQEAVAASERLDTKLTGANPIDA